jgi:hydroxymethylpyrimidine/phosphomethylpyrimidine kinase
VQPPCALTIAGSDSGGGAGLQADIKAMAAHGVFGASAVTAITAQNTTEVRMVEVLAADLVLAQIAAVCDDMTISGVKCGMLGSVDTVHAIAGLIDDGALCNVVVDPVFITSTGHSLIGPGGVEAYREVLAPRAFVLTPNLDEAAALLSCSPDELDSEAALRDAALALAALGATYVVVKGGHFEDPKSTDVVDVVAHGTAITALRHARVRTANTHGTGCTFSAIIAAQLAKGHEVNAAIATAADAVHAGLVGARSWSLGHGSGPLDHFGWETPAT